MADKDVTSGALVPVRTERVTFDGDLILAVQMAEGAIYVPLRPICEHLGVAWSSQLQRVRQDPDLAESLRSVLLSNTGDRAERTVMALPLALLPGWLFGFTPARVKPELREKVSRYRRECFRVLWEAFQGDILPPAPPSTTTGAALALEIATAVAALARGQLEAEARLDAIGNKQEIMAGYLRGFIHDTQTRLGRLELHLPAGDTISETQAAEIALAVKNIGKRFEAHGDRTGYAKVYAEIYRRYGLSSYKHLPAARFPEVQAWLQAWYAELAGEPPAS